MRNGRFRSGLVLISSLLLSLACSGDGEDGGRSSPGLGGGSGVGGGPVAGSGGVNGAGGAAGGGLPSSTGGAAEATGGALPTGGAAETGGNAATGGTTPTGGAVATGGTATTGGRVATGGAILTGGAVATGGAAETGGNETTGGAEATGGAPETGGVVETGGAVPIGGAGSGGEPGTGGELGTGGTPPVDVDPDALIAAPDGVTGAAGTLDEPTTLADAVARVEAGQTIYLRGGTYALGSTVGLSQSGSDGSPLELRAYPLDADRPRLDFSSMAEGSSNRGVSLSGDHWHLYGLDLVGAGDNCMFVSGSNNVVEFSTFSECADTGLQLGNGAAHNLVLNCDSYFNADSSLENADGFAAKLDVGTGNRFVGCRAWNNLDDGWDGYLRPADGVTTTYEDCWAIDNGKLRDGTVGAGDGNGFKTGGSDDKDLSHHAVYERCISAGNVHDGFDHNSNRGSVTLLNCAAHGNGSNINFSSTNIAASLTIKNTISLGSNGGLTATSTDITNNSWQGGLSATDGDFVSVDAALLKSPRKSDGSLPEIDTLRLVSGSDLRNAGVDVGLPYRGSAPDLGPFEGDE